MRVEASTSWSRIAADVDDADTASILEASFRGMGDSPGGTERPYVVATVTPASPGLVEVSTPDATNVARSGMAAALLVATAFNTFFIDACPDFAVHAAVLLTDSGAIALPAESGTGKSTLTAACLLSGFAYLSDEALVLDPAGMVIPYPRPLALSTWSQTALGMPVPLGRLVTNREQCDEDLVGPSELGRVAGSSCRPGLRAVIRLRRGRRAQPHLEAQTQSQAVADLLRNSFNHYRDPARAVSLTSHAVRTAETLKLDMADPTETATLLAEHFGLRRRATC